MKKILIIFGTRPELIKLYPIIIGLRKTDVDLQICFTGQHNELIIDLINELDIRVDYSLELIKNPTSMGNSYVNLHILLFELISKMIPDLIIIHGDTSSASMGALVGFTLKIPIAHVEAGLRSFDISSPYPEEFNRKLISIAANLHFAPTIGSMNNLINEGIDKQKIHVTGNTIVDAIKIFYEREYDDELSSWASSGFILFTLHRRELTAEKIMFVIQELISFSKSNPEHKILFPIHRNPIIRDVVLSFSYSQTSILVTESIPYPRFISLLKRARLIVTDSGGLQEEASILDIPLLILRDNTERPEVLSKHSVKLVGSMPINLPYLINESLVWRVNLSKTTLNDIFGSGDSSIRIVNIIKDYLRLK